MLSQTRRHLGRVVLLAGRPPLVAAVTVLPSATSVPRRTKYHGRHLFPDLDKRLIGLTRRTKPFMHGNSSDLDFKVEGVSDKQFPIMLQWERPRHIQRWEPNAEGSGDCEGIPDVDMSLPRLQFEGSDAYRDAPDVVKKVLSLEFARNRDIIERVRDSMVRSVQRHHHDFSSLEVTIAQMTVRIRNMQKILTSHLPKENPCVKHVVKVLVDHRRCLLRRLREEDYKKFEWLLEKLNLVYKPRPFFWEMVERKKHLTRLTELWCDELRQYRLDELKQKMLDQQHQYLTEKAETLRWMMKEEEELGMPRTVREEDVQECVKKAEEVEAARQAKKDGPVKEYFVYRPEVQEDYNKFIS